MIKVKSNLIPHTIMRAFIAVILLVSLVSLTNATSSVVWSYTNGAWYNIYGYDGYRFYVTPLLKISNSTGFIGAYQEIEIQTDDGYYELVLVYYPSGTIKANLVKDTKYRQTPLTNLNLGQTYVFTVICENNKRNFILSDMSNNVIWQHASQMNSTKCVKDLASSKGYPLRAASEIFWDYDQITDSTQWYVSTAFSLEKVYDGALNAWMTPTGVRTSAGIKQYIDGANTSYRGYNIVYSNGQTLTTQSKFPDPTLPKAQITLSDIQGYAIVMALGGGIIVAYEFFRRGV